jgi:hypothetical protein
VPAAGISGMTGVFAESSATSTVVGASEASRSISSAVSSLMAVRWMADQA